MHPHGFAHTHIARITIEKAASQRTFALHGKFMCVSLVELSGIEPLTSSLRIQDVTSDGETPDDPK